MASRSSWWPKQDGTELESKRYIPAEHVNNLEPGFVSSWLGNSRLELNGENDMGHSSFSLMQTISVNSWGTVSFVIDQDIIIEIFNDRSMRLVDRTLNIAGSFNSKNELAMVHPRLRALITRWDSVGMACYNSENRYEYLFRINTYQRRVMNSIHYTSDRYKNLMVFQMYQDKVDIRLKRPPRMRDLYENFTKDICGYYDDINQEAIVKDLAQSGYEKATKEGDRSMYLRNFEILQTHDGKVKILDHTRPKGQKLRLEYSHKDTHLELVGYLCRMEADDINNIAMMGRDGSIVTVFEDYMFLNVHGNKLIRREMETLQHVGNQAWPKELPTEYVYRTGTG